MKIFGSMIIYSANQQRNAHAIIQHATMFITPRCGSANSTEYEAKLVAMKTELGRTTESCLHTLSDDPNEITIVIYVITGYLKTNNNVISVQKRNCNVRSLIVEPALLL